MTIRRFSVVLLFAVLFGTAASAGVLERGIFRIVHEPKDKAVAEQTMAYLEEAVEEFGERLPPGEDPIRVVIAATPEAFARHASAFSSVKVSGLAKSHRGLIVLKAPYLRTWGGDYRGTLRHELVHILLYRNVNTDAYLPRWLNEGLAMRLANEHRWDSTFTVGRMFLRNGIIPYRNLDRAFLQPGSELEFGDAYAQALSMTRFLRKQLGEERFWAVVLGCREAHFARNLEEHGGWSVLEFWRHYEHSLWRVTLMVTLSSGSLFTPAAFLLMAAYWRKRRSNRVILARWEAEEAATEGIELFRWEDHVDGPYEWEEDEEEEPWRNG